MAIRSLKTGTFTRSGMAGNPVIMPGSYESIASTTLSTDTSSITFSSIPNTYSHLQLRFMAKANNAGDLEYLVFGSFLVVENFLTLIGYDDKS